MMLWMSQSFLATGFQAVDILTLHAWCHNQRGPQFAIGGIRVLDKDVAALHYNGVQGWETYMHVASQIVFPWTHNGGHIVYMYMLFQISQPFLATGTEGGEPTQCRKCHSFFLCHRDQEWGIYMVTQMSQAFLITQFEGWGHTRCGKSLKPVLATRT